jgi:hypothetical protein
VVALERQLSDLTGDMHKAQAGRDAAEAARRGSRAQRWSASNARACACGAGGAHRARPAGRGRVGAGGDVA